MVQIGKLFTLARGHESPQGGREERNKEKKGSHQKLPTNRDLFLSSSNYGKSFISFHEFLAGF